MPVANFQHKIKLENIVIKRDERQRRKIETPDDLIHSIERIGLLNPIILRREDKSLVAGERRFTAYQHLVQKYAGTEKEADYASIPYRYLNDLDPQEAFYVELEENIKRKDLSWQDEAQAIAKYHDMLCDENPKQTLAETAKLLGVSETMISKATTVTEYIKQGDKLVLDADTLNAAYNVTRRKAERAGDDALNMLLNTANVTSQATQVKLSPSVSAEGHTPTDGGIPEISAGDASEPVTPSDHTRTNVTPTGGERTPRAVASVVTPTGPAAPEQVIVNADFQQWVQSYNGMPFDLLHCDFPYGINHQKSGQGNAKAFDAYDDSPDVYWSLCKALVGNLDKVMFQSGHMIFWYSMKYHQETIDFFNTHGKDKGLKVCPVPLVWLKSDNKGIAPDVERLPRQIYETALFISRGDRKIIQLVGNAVACPTVKSIHASVKPVAMLQHFFRMVVDKSTRMLDPTCGSGSSVRAAESMDARFAMGLEINKESADAARRELVNARALGIKAL